MISVEKQDYTLKRRISLYWGLDVGYHTAKVHDVGESQPMLPLVVGRGA